MTYREVPVTPEILSFVLANIWERGRVELSRLGLTLGDAYQRFSEYAKDNYAGALVFDDKPVLVAGIVDDGAECWTWMQSTEEFKDHALAVTRHIRNITRNYPEPVFIYSVLCHEEAGRWFKTLGFAPDGWQGRTPSGHALTRFARR